MRDKLLYLLMILVVLAACRNDYLQQSLERSEQSKPALVSKIISLNESMHKGKITPMLSKLKQSYKSGVAGKSVSFGDSISIDTEKVIYIENGPNYHTYTFKINRTNPLPNDPVENLLLTPLPDGTYKEFLVTYNFTAQEKAIVQNGGYVDTKGKTEVKELFGSNFSGVLSKNVSCSYETVTIEFPCKDPNGAAHKPGEPCNMKGADRAFSYTIVALVCNTIPDVSNPDVGGP